MQIFGDAGARSVGIQLLLERVEARYDCFEVELASGAQRREAFVALNLKTKVPLLIRSDGSSIPEFQIIAFWPSRAYTRARLMGDTQEDSLRIMEWMDYLVGTVHMRGWSLFKRPQKFTSEATGQKEFSKYGETALFKGRTRLDEAYEPGSILLETSGLLMLHHSAS